jgi:hypothetical protein
MFLDERFNFTDLDSSPGALASKEFVFLRYMWPIGVKVLSEISTFSPPESI